VMMAEREVYVGTNNWFTGPSVKRASNGTSTLRTPQAVEVPGKFW